MGIVSLREDKKNVNGLATRALGECFINIYLIIV